MRRRQGLPPREPTTVQPGLMFYWIAFWDLMSCRSVGMGEGPIPWTAVDAYSRRHSLEGQDFEDLWHIIRRLDAHYMKFRAQQREQEAKRTR